MIVTLLICATVLALACISAAVSVMSAHHGRDTSAPSIAGSFIVSAGVVVIGAGIVAYQAVAR